MSDKKQIEEMAKLACTVFDGNCSNCPFNFYPPCPPKASAERLFNAGYRKQSEGEWVKHGYKWRCTSCNYKINIDGTPTENNLYFCSNCGAKMKGE